jgi:hypothetical protein
VRSARIDNAATEHLFDPMTATLLIKQLKALPAREQRKVYRYVFETWTPTAVTRRALQENVVRALGSIRLRAS